MASKNILRNSLIIGVLIPISLTNGIYESWRSLNEYELEKENFKTTYRKIEKSCIGFSTGLLYGVSYGIFSPIILPSIAIAGIHTFMNKK